MVQFGSPPSSRVLSRDVLLQLLQLLGFWGSVILPVAYFPVLFATSGSVRRVLLTALVALNVACLIAGHRYSP